MNGFSEASPTSSAWPGVDGHNKRAVLNVLSEDHCPPSALPNSFDEGTLGVRRGSGTYLSRLGCALSHLKAILRAHDDGREYALIMEDDATPDLVPTWAGSLSDFVKTLPEDWTIVQLSALSYEDKLKDLFTQWQETRRNERAPDLTTLPKRAGSLIWSAQAYLVSREGMKKIAAKYRREDGGLDLCAASCIELDDCVLQEGVPEEGYRIATPPLFVPRQDMTSTIGQTDAEDDEGLGKVAETEGTRKMYEESRDVLYKWAGSWALNDRKSANLNMDADTLRDIMDAVLDLQGKKNSRVTTDSFKQAFHAYCENGENGCTVEKAYLKNVVNPREVVDDDDEDVVERVESSRDSKKASKRARRPRGAVHRIFRETEVEDGRIPRRPREGGSSDEHRASRRRPKRPERVCEDDGDAADGLRPGGVRRLRARRDGGVRGGPETRDTCQFRGRDDLVVGVGGKRRGARIDIE